MQRIRAKIEHSKNNMRGSQSNVEVLKMLNQETEAMIPPTHPHSCEDTFQHKFLALLMILHDEFWNRVGCIRMTLVFASAP